MSELPSGMTPPEPVPDVRGKARRECIERIDCLERLTQNPDFARYLERFAGEIRDLAAGAVDVKRNDTQTRDALAQRHFGMALMVKWPWDQLAIERDILKAMNEAPLQSPYPQP